MTKKIALGIFLFLIVFAVVVLVFAPTFIRNYVEKNSNELIGRSIELKKLHVNYFKGKISLIDFKLFEPDDTIIFVSFDTLIINTEPYRLLIDEVIIERLYLKGLKANIVMNDSVFNFNDLLLLNQSDTIDRDTTQGEPIKFVLSNFELNDAQLNFKDMEIDKQMELSNLDFFVPYLSWDQEHASEAGLRFEFKNGGYFESSIDVNPNKGDFNAELDIIGLDISGYNDFVRKYIDVGNFSGTSSLMLNIDGNINSIEESLFDGTFKLDSFQLEDQNSKKLVRLPEFHVAVSKIDISNNDYILDSVVLDGPMIHFNLYDSTNNISDYVNALLSSGSKSDEDSVIATAENKKATDTYYKVNHMSVISGSAEILDKRTANPFEYHLSEIDMKLDSISSESDWIEVNADMLLNKRGKLVASVGLNPNDPMNMEVDYTISDFMLSDLNIYSTHYMGFPILYGDMYYKAHTEIDNGNIASANKLIIHNVELGTKQGGLYKLPLKFALFLLKDKDGVITLDVPVSGDLKNPKVSARKIVWNTFKNLIIKAATAPGKLLAGLVGAKSHEIEAIEFEYLDTTFSEKRKHQLDLLMELEKAKPDLEIELVYFNDPEMEKGAISAGLVGKEFEAKNPGMDHINDEKQFLEYVLDRVDNDTLELFQACRMLTDSVEVDSMIATMNGARMAGLSSYLEAVGDSTEIHVVSSNPKSPKNIGAKPVFEVKYGMKEEHIQ